MTDRFWERVDVRGSDECWPWLGLIDDSGYGRTTNGYAHRVAFTLEVGEIPAGLELDHLCHNAAWMTCPMFWGGVCPHRRCVNPAHLRAVTHAENCADRPKLPPRAVCRNGHPYDEENTYLYPDRDGKRDCRECTRASLRAWHARNRDEQNEKRRQRRLRAKTTN